MPAMSLIKALCVVLAVILSIPAAFALDQTPMHLPVDSRPLVINTSKGDVPFAVEIADDDTERQRGLMFRTDLKDNSAMLFVFDQARQVTMWMENTPSALDMLFLDEKGRITTIRQNAVPFSRDIIASDGPASYTVEVKAGTVRRLGIAVGDKVRHPSIKSDGG